VGVLSETKPAACLASAAISAETPGFGLSEETEEASAGVAGPPLAPPHGKDVIIPSAAIYSPPGSHIEQLPGLDEESGLLLATYCKHLPGANGSVSRGSLLRLALYRFVLYPPVLRCRFLYLTQF